MAKVVTQQLIDDILRGKYGSGKDIAANVIKAGYNWVDVQPKYMEARKAAEAAAEAVKETVATAAKSLEEVAKEVIKGVYGNGQERKDKLAAAGYDYAAVQSLVNDLLAGKVTTAAATATKTVEEVAKEVIRGLWGNGQERKDKLAAAGYDYATIQAKVNELLK